MMTGYGRGGSEDIIGERYQHRRPASLAPKDYSVPLHVDCSIEYELPDCAKPPQGVKIEPLLMIHPAHFRRLESLRRVPFVNNLPREGSTPSAAAGGPVEGAAVERRGGGGRRCCRGAVAPLPQPAGRREAMAAVLVPPLKRSRPHPYLPALPPYERFDARALQPLPIYL